MSGSNNVAHVSSMDKGLKMKIKRTKIPNKQVDSKHEVMTSDPRSCLASSPPFTVSAATAINKTAASPVSAVISSSLSLFLSSSASSSMISQSAANPTVVQLKAADTPSGIMTPGRRSPLKTASSGTSSPDTATEGRPPKTKAAHGKKLKSWVDTQPNMVTSGVVSADLPTTNVALIQLTSSAAISSMAQEPRPGDAVHIKRENLVHDPYEFNAKVEDKIELPPKKLKLEKADYLETAIAPPVQQPAIHHLSQQPHKRSVGVDVSNIGVITEPDCLGPCEPGTAVGLEGIVWKETDTGLLVVNVTWRGKTYVGTLMDATKYAWAPPRPSGCESPVSDFELRTPKGRGKRSSRNSAQASDRLPESRALRKSLRGTVNSSGSFTAPPSPADICTSSVKRRNNHSQLDRDSHRRSRSCSRGLDSPAPDGYIMCPEPNCQKKYKHMNGLRYHRTHAHRSLTCDVKGDEGYEEEGSQERNEKTNLSERAERMKAKDRQRMKEQRSSNRDSLDDDIPLKEIASKVSGQATISKTDMAKGKTEQESNEGASMENLDLQSGSTKANITACKGTLSSTNDALPNRNDADLAYASSSMLTVNDSSVSAVVSSGSKLNSTKLQAYHTPFTVLDGTNTFNSQVNTSHIMYTSTSSQVSTSHNMLTSASSQANTSQCMPTSANYQTYISRSIPTSANSQTNTSHIVPTSASSQANMSHSVLNLSHNDITHNLVTPQLVPFPVSVSGLPKTSSTIPSITTDKQNGGKNLSCLKTMSAARPIVPALSGQVDSAGNCQPSPQTGYRLKLIQPRPTIMGEYSHNPVLTDLSREKSRKPKKKKDKDPPGIVPLEQHQGQAAREAVSQEPMTKSQQVQEEPPHGDIVAPHVPVLECEQATATNLSRLFHAPSPNSDMSSSPFHPSIDLLHTPVPSPLHHAVIPPSTLSMTSDKGVVSDDVLSPAYSDISDANDSSSPLQQGSPKKDSSLKTDEEMGGEKPLHCGSMYYFGAGPSYLPHSLPKKVMANLDEEPGPSCSDSRQEDTSLTQGPKLQHKSPMSYYTHVSPSGLQLLAGLSPVLDPSCVIMAHHADQKCVQQSDVAGRSDDGSGKRTLPPSICSGGANEGASIKSGSVGLGDQRAYVDDGQVQESHRVPKDNIETKLQLGSHQQMALQQEHKFHMLKQQNDLLRAQMYQQKLFDHQRLDKRSHLPEQSIGGCTASGLAESTPQEHILIDTMKREGLSTKDSPKPHAKMDGVELKQFDIKDEITLARSTLSAPLDMVSKLGPTSMANIPAAVSGATSAVITGPAFPYGGYYPHLRPMQLEPMYRSINPHIIFAPPGYLHPTQLTYRMPPAPIDRKTPDMETARNDGPSLGNSAGHMPIHKLRDKGRLSLGIHSPAPGKAVDGDRSLESGTSEPVPDKAKDKQRGYNSSPPPQRHVHTHHHTHVMGGFYAPDAYTAMFGHPAASIQGPVHPFPPPAEPKS